MSPVLVFCIVLLVLYILIKYNWDRRDLYKLSWKLEGPFALPIIGNAFFFLFNSIEDTIPIAFDLLKKYNGILRGWMGPQLWIFTANPNDIQHILSSQKITHKGAAYRFFNPIFGQGLINNNGQLWRMHRKIIVKSFSQDFLSEYMNIFHEQSKVMVANMQKEVGKPAFDVMKYVQLCAMDIVGEAVMDVKLNVQSEHNMEVVSSLDNIYMLIHDRILKYWLHPDFIFENTAKGKLQHKVVNYLRNFIQKNVLRKQEEVSNNNSIKCKSTLETILHTLNDNPEAMSKQGIIDEMITLFAAGEDSISLQFSWTLLLLALHPEIQDKVYNEIQSVLGDNENFGRDDLKKLYYTTMVIKEVSRLFPVAPFIVREVTEDFPIDKVVLPRGTSVFIGVMYVHRDPSHWEYPNKFYPEHFLPEAVAKRHPFAFMPFSAGARGCIGKEFAMLCMKSMLVTILRNFQLQADGTINDIKLKVDIIARSMNGYNLRLVQRINTL